MSRKKVIDQDRILDAAEQVIVETGGLGMTQDAVAERAGISKGGLTYTFPTKDDLISAAMARESERFEGAITRAAPDASFYGRMLGYAAEMLRQEDAASLRKAATLLTALIHAPAMLDPARAYYKAMLEGFEDATEAGRRARLAILALEAVFWMRGTGAAQAPAEVWRPILQDAYDAVRAAYLEQNAESPV